MPQGPAAAVEGGFEVAFEFFLGDPNIMRVTNTKGEVSFSGGSCTALCAPLGGHRALTDHEPEALSVLHIACSMHLSKWALMQMPRICTHCNLKTVWKRAMPYFPKLLL